MLSGNFHILPVQLLDLYKKAVADYNLGKALGNLKDAELSTGAFSFYTSVASVYSSKIEGEDIELDSYVRHKRFGVPFKPDYTKKIDDLYEAYQFAQTHPLTEENVAKAHGILARNFISSDYLGKYRTQNMYVTTADGKIEYVAAEPQMAKQEMEKFFADVKKLSEDEMETEEVFFFAAILHLVFVKIHPRIDGNGRSARLIEKWFLSEKLGANARFIQSEKFYYEHHQIYYNNIRALGLEYPSLDYSKALPFALMLAESLTPSSS